MDWGVIQTIVTVVSVVLAAVFGIRLARKKKPTWAYGTIPIIGLGTNAPPELKLTFEGQPITDAYLTRLVFFNRGNETVRSNDVTQSILIHFQGARILRPPMVLAQSKQAIEASAKQVIGDDNDGVRLRFLYLDHNDGMVVEVLHTQSQSISCSGNIIGTNEIRCVGEFVTFRRRFWVFLFGIFGSMAILFSAGFLFALAREESKQLAKGDYWIPLLVVCVLGAAMFWIANRGWLHYIKLPKWSRPHLLVPFKT